MKIYFLVLFFIVLSAISSECKAQNNELNLKPLGLWQNEDGLYQLPFSKKGNKNRVIHKLPGVSIQSNQTLTFEFLITKETTESSECRTCVAEAGFIIDDYCFLIQNNKKDLRIYIGKGEPEELPYYIINGFAENLSIAVYLKKRKEKFEWAIETPFKTIGSSIPHNSKNESEVSFTYSPVQGNLISYFIGNPKIGETILPKYKPAELHPLFKYRKTAINKYDWDEPAAKYLVLESVKGEITSKELNGLKKYLLNYQLPTHNYMNYYFRKRMNSYMMEWMFQKTADKKLLEKAIQVAHKAIEYRNDNFGKYKISYNRAVAPLWPNYKEIEVYEDGSVGIVPGASTFAGLPTITIPIRIIANNPQIWEHKFEGKTYYNIALELVDEALKTIDYTYDVFVGADNLIRYPNTLLRKEWRGKVYIYNRVFPLISGSIPLVEALEKFHIKGDKVERIDKVNQAMLSYLQNDVTFYGTNDVPYVKYPYSQTAQDKDPNKEHVEDFTHGAFDSRDFQLFYKSGRYNFDEKILKAIANNLVDKVARENGKFSERMDGSGKAKAFTTPISYDGFIWYAKYRPEVYEVIIDHIIENEIAIKGGVWDVYCLYEILKLKDNE